MKRQSMMIRCAAVALVLVAGAAQARDTRLTLPLEPALRAARSQLPADAQLLFGSASAEGLKPLTTVQVQGAGVPYGTMRSPAHGGPVGYRRSDAEMCQDGFNKAVVELQRRVSAVGGVAAAGIISYYSGTETNSRDAYDCRVGMTRAVVEFKAQVVGSLERTGVAPAAMPAPAPAAMPAPAVSTAPAAGHRITPPAATGYAKAHEAGKVPFLDEAGRQRYAEWLLRPTPRAVAVHPSGRAGFASANASAMEAALSQCEQATGAPCFLYAVDEQVVWSQDPAQRITLRSLAR